MKIGDIAYRWKNNRQCYGCREVDNMCWLDNWDILKGIYQENGCYDEEDLFVGGVKLCKIMVEWVRDFGELGE